MKKLADISAQQHTAQEKRDNRRSSPSKLRSTRRTSSHSTSSRTRRRFRPYSGSSRRSRPTRNTSCCRGRRSARCCSSLSALRSSIASKNSTRARSSFQRALFGRRRSRRCGTSCVEKPASSRSQAKIDRDSTRKSSRRRVISLTHVAFSTPSAIRTRPASARRQRTLCSSSSRPRPTVPKLDRY
jgi:hypothetical protein